PDGGKEDPFRPPQARTLEDAHANEVGALVRDLGRGRVGRARSHGSKTRDGRVHPRVLARPIECGVPEPLLVPERVDGIQARGLPCRDEAEDDADERGDDERDEDDLGREDERHVEKAGEQYSAAEAKNDLEETHEDAQKDSLEEKLQQHYTDANTKRKQDPELNREHNDDK